MPSYELQTDATGDGGLVRIEISGELDMTNAREVEALLDEDVHPENRLVLDLNRVSFVDSAALHMLFRLARKRGRDGFAILVEQSAPAAGTLALAGLDKVTTVSATLPSVDAARDSH